MIEQKLLKIKAMAERGTIHEKEVASRMLNDLIAKYGIDPDSLEEENEEVRWFVVTNKMDKKLIFQIYAVVMHADELQYWTKKKNSKVVGFKLTDTKYELMQAFWKTYRRHLRREIEERTETIFNAFLKKHNLFPPANPDTKSESISMEEYKKIVDLMDEFDDLISPIKQVN